jgi:hypothetical protein
LQCHSGKGIVQHPAIPPDGRHKLRKPFKYLAAVLMAVFLSTPCWADNIADLGNIAILAQLGPACGIHDVQWGNDLLQADSQAIQAVIPSPGMFPDDETFAKWKAAQAVVGAGYIDGQKLFQTYGKDACKIFITPYQLGNAESFVKSYDSGQKQQFIDPAKPGGIPTGALNIAWILSRGDLAISCGIKSENWGDDAAVAGVTPLSQAAYGNDASLSDDDKNTAFNNATAAYKFDQTIANAEYGSSLPGCKSVKTSADLALIDTYIKKRAANPDPWAGVSQ